MFLKKFSQKGYLSFLETIVRIHPYSYYLSRKLVKYTNLFETEALGIRNINFKKKINILDIGASDGISANFFLNNLIVNKIFCFEPNKNYANILKKNSKLKVFQYGLGAPSKNLVYIPYFYFFFLKFYLITYTANSLNNCRKFIKNDFFFSSSLRFEKTFIDIKKTPKINNKISLIKIDTNGSEYEILKSLKEIIIRDKPVILLEYVDLKKKIDTFLLKKGYKRYYFYSDKKKLILVKKSSSYQFNFFFLTKVHKIID